MHFGVCMFDESEIGRHIKGQFSFRKRIPGGPGFCVNGATFN
jgi:hypothetical protein